VSRETQKYSKSVSALILYGQVLWEVEGHQERVTLHICPSVQHSSVASQQQCWEFASAKGNIEKLLFQKFGMTKCSIERNLKHISGFVT
jgi:hypothetical protein